MNEEMDAPSLPQASALDGRESASALKELRRYTPARIALRRVGASLATAEVLDFSLAHARARDAVHIPLDVEPLRLRLAEDGFLPIAVRSRVRDRTEYLRRPDLGRQLDPSCRDLLLPAPATDDRPTPDRPMGDPLTLVLADGLSSLAVARHGVAMVLALGAQLASADAGWALDSRIVLATDARVALGDEIGALRGAEAVVILIGERPGLGAVDSLGLYMTYHPQPGRTDAERNCISNVRTQGLSYAEAAYRLSFLLSEARRAGRSGIAIKDATDRLPTPSLRD